MLKIIRFILFLPICLLSQEKKVPNDVLIVDYTYITRGEGMPSDFVINSTLTANQYDSLYEMDFLGQSNFQKEEDSEKGVILAIKPKNNGFIFKDHINNSIYSIEDVDIRSFLVKDTISIFNWDLKLEFKDILGYKCQKATAYYRGRNYEAFFTTDIPYQIGPWKFCNLPGLILEVYSVDSVFKITANKLQMKNMGVKIENPFQKNIDKTMSWDAFIIEYKRRYNELLHYRYPNGGTTSIPKKGIETYIN